jgi:hypothetical protein
MPRIPNRTFRDVAIVAEATFTLAVVSIALSCVPFRLIAPRLGRPAVETPPEESARRVQRIRRTRWAMHTSVRRVPLTWSCLTQAIAAKAMLRRRGIASTLYLGVDTGSPTGLSAHAWLRAGPEVVTGEAGRDQFGTVASFAE